MIKLSSPNNTSSLTMNTIKQVLRKKSNTGLGCLDQSDPSCPSSPTIFSVFVMDKNDTKVTFRDDEEIESEGSEEIMSLVLR